MPTKKPTELPKKLKYLQPFVNALAKLPPEDLNEDVDASRLEAALRKAVRGLDEEGVEAKIAEDRLLLKKWLETRPNHPAYWVLGSLLLPDLAKHLTEPPEPPPRGPKIIFNAPAGWKITPAPFRLDLKAGKVIGSITAIEKSTFELLDWQQKQWKVSPGLKITRQILKVRYGRVSGKKIISLLIKPVSWKDVDYLLIVPGGFVSIFLGTMTGAAFEESSLEAKLHTLRLSARKDRPEI